jgi:hypothetical protein
LDGLLRHTGLRRARSFDDPGLVWGAVAGLLGVVANPYITSNPGSSGRISHKGMTLDISCSFAARRSLGAPALGITTVVR